MKEYLSKAEERLTEQSELSTYIKGNVSGSKKNGNNNNNSLTTAIFWEGIFKRKFFKRNLFD